MPKPEGKAVLDIGGGSCDLGILSLGGIVESASIKIGGESFDEGLIRYLRKNRGILIGKRIAEEIKIEIGCILPRPEEKKSAYRAVISRAAILPTAKLHPLRPHLLLKKVAQESLKPSILFWKKRRLNYCGC